MDEPSRAANRMPGRYREVAVTTVDFALTEARLRRHFLDREAYRRTGYVVVHGPDGVALLEVAKASTEDLFSPIIRVDLLAGPDEAAFIHAPGVDLGVPSQVCLAAIEQAPDARCAIVHGKYEHITFILDPAPIRVRLAEVAPPYPPKLLDQARRVLEVAEDLVPIVLEPEIFDLVELAAEHPADRYLFPCRGSGIAPEGKEVFYLDERPPRADWVLVGCERSLLRRRAAGCRDVPAGDREAGTGSDPDEVLQPRGRACPGRHDDGRALGRDPERGTRRAAAPRLGVPERACLRTRRPRRYRRR